MKRLLTFAVAVALTPLTPILAQEAMPHLMVDASQLVWGPAPPVFAPGAQMTVVQGDPGNAGDYVVRLRMPDGYRIMPHWHPADENVTVISGLLHIAAGDTFDPTAGSGLGPAGYASLPAGMHHFAWAEGVTEVQIHGKGPFALTYVNPEDDPRQSTAPTSY